MIGPPTHREFTEAYAFMAVPIFIFTTLAIGSLVFGTYCQFSKMAPKPMSEALYVLGIGQAITALWLIRRLKR